MKLIVNSVLFMILGLSNQAFPIFYSGTYLSPEELPPHLCLIQSGPGLWSSCIIIGEQTVLTTDHTISHLRSAGSDSEALILVFVQGRPPFKGRAKNLQFFSATPLAPFFLRSEVDEAQDLALLHIPELTSYTQTTRTMSFDVFNSSQTPAELELLYRLMSQWGSCYLYGVGARFNAAGGIDSHPALHGALAPAFNSLSNALPNPMTLQGFGVTAGPGDSGGAYVCHDRDRLFLVGMIVSGQPDVEDSQQQRLFSEQLLKTVILPFSSKEIWDWLSTRIK